MTNSAGNENGMPTRAILWSAASTIIILLVAGAAFQWGRAVGTKTHSRSAPLPDLGAAPSYSLVNQLGQTVRSNEFDGKVQVVTFLFPYCTTVCPLIAAHLTDLINLGLKPAGLQDKVSVVAFNVDPGGTSQADMKEFLTQYGWNPTDLHWQYLTGSPDEIRRVVTKGFHVAYRKVSDSSSDDGASAGPVAEQVEVRNNLAAKANVKYDIVHNDLVEIVDAHGHIRKIYSDADLVGPRQMLEDIRNVLAHPDS